MNNIFSYIDKKSEMTQDITQLYQNSLIFIRDEQQIYQPLINTYIGIGKTEFENTKNSILSYSKKIYVNDIIPANQSGQNTSYFFPLIYGSFKGNYYDTYTTNYIGFNAATNKIVGNIEGSASKLDTPINVTLYSSAYYPSSYTTTFDGSTNLNIQIPEEFENTIKTIEEVTSYALNDLNDKCSYNTDYSYNVYNNLYKDIHNYTQLSQGITNDDTVTIYKTLAVTEEWMDSGIVINPTTFPKGTGTYAIQISHGNLNSPNTNGYASIYSGMISIYVDSTSSTTDSEEIILHRAGHSWSNRLYIRTMPTGGGTSKIQIASSKTWTQSSNITFKFRKLI